MRSSPIRRKSYRTRLACRLQITLARGNVFFDAPLFRPSGTRESEAGKEKNTAPLCARRVYNDYGEGEKLREKGK